MQYREPSIDLTLLDSKAFLALFDDGYYIEQLRNAGLVYSLGYTNEYLDSFSRKVLAAAEECCLPKTSVTLILHYLTIGWIKELSPNWLYDPKFIRNEVRVPQSAYNIFRFCFDRGNFDFDPHPIFSTKFYKINNVDGGYVAHPLLHYLTVGIDFGHAPHILFDPHWYSDNNSIAVSKSLHHFFVLNSGRRDPSPLVSMNHLYAQFKSKDAQSNVFAQYLVEGDLNGISPHKLYDPMYFRSKYKGDISKLSYLDYLMQPNDCEVPPHPKFFSHWYRKQIGATPKNYAATMLHHYLYYGYKEGRTISPYMEAHASSINVNSASTPQRPIDFEFKNTAFTSLLNIDLVMNELEKVVQFDTDLERVRQSILDGVRIFPIKFDEIIQASVVEAMRAVSSFDCLVIAFDVLEKIDLYQLLNFLREDTASQQNITAPLAILGCRNRTDTLDKAYQGYFSEVALDRIDQNDLNSLSEIIKAIIFSMKTERVIFILSQRSLLFLRKYLKQLCSHCNVTFFLPDRLDDIEIAAFVQERSSQTRIRMEIACSSSTEVFRHLSEKANNILRAVPHDLESLWTTREIESALDTLSNFE